MNSKNYTILFILVFSVLSYAQNDSLKIREVFLKSQKFYASNKSYQLDLDYTLYKSATDKTVLEAYKSQVIKNGEDYYSKIYNIEFIKIGDKGLKIDHNVKEVYVFDNLPNSDPMTLINDMLVLLPDFKSYKIYQKQNLIICEFRAPDVTQLPYSAAYIKFDKTTYALVGQTLDLANGYGFVEDNKKDATTPRLKINLQKIKSYQPDAKFKLSTYVTFNQNKARLTPAYSKYKLISNL